jgi:hypothetical protein
MNRFLGGIELVFLGPTLLEKKLKKDSISFSKKRLETQVTNALAVQTHSVF